MRPGRVACMPLHSLSAMMKRKTFLWTGTAMQTQLASLSQ